MFSSCIMTEKGGRSSGRESLKSSPKDKSQCKWGDVCFLLGVEIPHLCFWSNIHRHRNVDGSPSNWASLRMLHQKKVLFEPYPKPNRKSAISVQRPYFGVLHKLHLRKLLLTFHQTGPKKWPILLQPSQYWMNLILITFVVAPQVSREETELGFFIGLIKCSNVSCFWTSPDKVIHMTSKDSNPIAGAIQPVEHCWVNFWHSTSRLLHNVIHPVIPVQRSVCQAINTSSTSTQFLCSELLGEAECRHFWLTLYLAKKLL